MLRRTQPLVRNLCLTDFDTNFLKDFASYDSSTLLLYRHVYSIKQDRQYEEEINGNMQQTAILVGLTGLGVNKIAASEVVSTELETPRAPQIFFGHEIPVL